LFASLGISGPERFVLVTLHPTTAQPEADAANLAATLGALAEVEDRSIIFTGVNADPGYRAIDDAISSFVAARPGRAHLFTSLGSERYWAALRLADAVVGNSSSGILEAPAVGVPSINIGDRQKGRLRAASIIDCPADADAVLASLQRIFDGRFQPDPGVDPPYGRGGASEAIAGTLRKIDLRRAFPKHFHDLVPSQEPSGRAL
jgi:UDP-hydrolysing UDP-N-acetyl-D-glucosamine 2-epimerase